MQELISVDNYKSAVYFSRNLDFIFIGKLDAR